MLRLHVAGAGGQRWTQSVAHVALFFAAWAPLSSAAVLGDEPNEERRQQLVAQREEIQQKVGPLQADGKFAEAVRALQSLLDVDRKLHAEAHDVVVDDLVELARLLAVAGDHARAHDAATRALQTAQRLHDAGHWRVTDARLAVDFVSRVGKLSADERRQVREALQSEWLAFRHHGQQEWDAALKLEKEATAAFRRLLGEDVVDFPTGLKIQADFQLRLGNKQEAAELYQRSAQIREELLGVDHPNYAHALLGLAEAQSQRDEGDQAEQNYRRAAAIYRAAVGEQHYWHGRAVGGLTRLLQQKGDLAGAEELYRQGLEIVKRSHGEQSLDYAMALRLLARFFMTTGRNADAERLLQQSRSILERQKTRPAAEILSVLEMLATAQYRDGRYKDAAPLFERVCALRKELDGEKDPYYAASLTDLAWTNYHLRRFEIAETHLKRALQSYEQAHGHAHANVAAAAANLGWFYRRVGKPKQAVTLYRRAVEFYQTPGVAFAGRYRDALQQLGSSYLDANDHAQAAQVYRKLADLTRDDPAADRQYLTALKRCAEALEQLLLQGGDPMDGKAAQRAADEILTRRRQTLGDAHWQTADARHLIARLRTIATLDAAQRKRLLESRSWWEQAERLAEQKDYSERLKLRRSVLQRREEIFGKQSPAYAEALQRIASTLFAEGKYDQCAAVYEQVLKLGRHVYGVNHPKFADAVTESARVADTLENRVQAHLAAERADDAVRAASDMLKLRRLAYADQHKSVIDARLLLEHVNRVVGLSAEQREQWKRARALDADTARLNNAGKYQQAVEAGAEALALYKQLLGTDDIAYRDTLLQLGTLYLILGNYPRAEECQRELVALTRRLLGTEHPDYAQSHFALGAVYARMSRFSDAQASFDEAARLYKSIGEEKSVDYARVLMANAVIAVTRGGVGRAEALLVEALGVFRAELGEESLDYATTLAALAAVYRATGRYDQAEQCYLRSLEIRTKLRGEKHYDIAESMVNLGQLYSDMGDYGRAESLFRKALKIYETSSGEDSPNYLDACNCIANVHMMVGDYAAAERIYRRVAATRKKLGPRHFVYAMAVSNLASFYQTTGDFSRSEALYQQTLDIFRANFGDDHALTAGVRTSLASLYESMDRFDAAEQLYLEALQAQRRFVGESSEIVAGTLHRLGWLNYRQGRYDDAERHTRRAAGIKREILGPDHPSYGYSINNLALIHKARREFEPAEKLFREALRIHEQKLGKMHPEYGITLDNLARLYADRGDAARAEPLMRESLAIYRRLLDQTSSIQSERGQLMMAALHRWRLNGYMLLAVEANVPVEQLYDHQLTWKGSVFTRQRRLRLLRDHPEVAEQLGELQRVSGQLANALITMPETPALPFWKQRIEELSKRREQLESDLSERSAQYQQQQKRVTPHDVRASLPERTALVDFDVYYDDAGDGWLFAFVIRHDRPIVLVKLGGTRNIEAAIEQWRAQIMRRGVASGTPTVDAKRNTVAQRLRNAVWEPLETHLDGVETVLLSPEGALARLPFAALPGGKAGSYLLEEFSLAVIPVPRLLPELMGGAEPTNPDPARHAGLLLVGDVDFDATPAGRADTDPSSSTRLVATRTRSLAAPRGTRSLQFAPLRGAKREVETISSLYRETHVKDRPHFIRGSEATESAFRTLAPESRFLHVATHGFFAPPGLASALDTNPFERRGFDPLTSSGATSPVRRHDLNGYHPGLLSGLAFAGANHGAQPGSDLGRITDDGILTALEVAEVDFRGTELVVLSACETGLGQARGGEGLLGLQRGFQVGGAATVVASLWKVDDVATETLMVEFYRNLWQRKLGTLAALREAQRAMLRRYDPVTKRLRKATPGSSSTPRRGNPPYYWAAFMLSGDWR